MTKCAFVDCQYLPKVCSKTMSMYVDLHSHIQHMLVDKCCHLHLVQWLHAAAHQTRSTRSKHQHKSWVYTPPRNPACWLQMTHTSVGRIFHPVVYKLMCQDSISLMHLHTLAHVYIDHLFSCHNTKCHPFCLVTTQQS
jgi:hypothetical protein